MKLNLKTIAAIITLTSFLFVVFFSFAPMSSGSDGQMASDCPFSTMGTSLCPQDIVASAIHHIAEYSAFLNVPTSTGFVMLIYLLLITYTIFIISIYRPVLGPPITASIKFYLLLGNLYKRKITRWLSLFENSPSYF